MRSDFFFFFKWLLGSLDLFTTQHITKIHNKWQKTHWSKDRDLVSSPLSHS